MIINSSGLDRKFRTLEKGGNQPPEREDHEKEGAVSINPIGKANRFGVARLI
jgi:hypothetical protein